MNEMKQYKVLIQKRADLVNEAKTLFAGADGRELTEEEKTRDDEIHATIENLDGEIARYERLRATERNTPGLSIPNYNKSPLGDSWAHGFQKWVLDGDNGGVGADYFGNQIEGMPAGLTILAASNPTDMNIGTAADGGVLVPTGFYNRIIERRDEMSLVSKLPLLLVPGVGTTVDIPVDDEDDGEFVATTEANTFDQDSPAMAKKQATLVMYTKYIDVSYQLLYDSPANLMEFLARWVGRGMAKTQNNLILTEVAANGTALKTFASATAIAQGEPEDIVGNDNLSNYLDEDNAVSWVMRSSTHWDIKSITGNDRQYASHSGGPKELLGYPVHYSQKAAAVAASAKSVYYGNWQYMAYRESPGLTFLRDPYTKSSSGQVRLLWHFQTVFKQTQAEAIGYGAHASA